MARQASSNGSGISRRSVLKQTAAAAAAGGATLVGGPLGLSAQAGGGAQTRSVAGRRFKAWVTRGFGPNSTTLEELRLLPISGRQLVVRTEASQLCYSCAGRVMGIQAAPQDNAALPGGPNPLVPEIQGHGAVGIVEAVGPDVRRVKVGDRVIVNVLPQCGQCYGCVTGRRRCMAGPMGPAWFPFAEMSDGRQVVQWGNVSGFSELVVPYEESVIPVVTDVPPSELALLHCVAGCGLGMAYGVPTRGPSYTMIDRGSDVVVFGAGPVGLSSIQGARILGAAQVIAVEPVKARRDLALKLGATAAVDPNVEGDNLVQKLREMCKGPSAGIYGGGGVPPNRWGPDYIIEAVGNPFVRPPREAGPDSIKTLQQIWTLCPDGGKLYTSGVGFPAGTMLTLDALSFTDGSKTHYGTTNGSARPLRDIPRNLTLIERGDFDAKSMVTSTPTLEQLKDAYKSVIEYTTISAVMVRT